MVVDTDKNCTQRQHHGSHDASAYRFALEIFRLNLFLDNELSHHPNPALAPTAPPRLPDSRRANDMRRLGLHPRHAQSSPAREEQGQAAAGGASPRPLGARATFAPLCGPRAAWPARSRLAATRAPARRWSRCPSPRRWCPE
eukprot:6189170-Pleurochrysis_carterae.AAC.1